MFKYNPYNVFLLNRVKDLADQSFNKSQIKRISRAMEHQSVFNETKLFLILFRLFVATLYHSILRRLMDRCSPLNSLIVKFHQLTYL